MEERQREETKRNIYSFHYRFQHFTTQLAPKHCTLREAVFLFNCSFCATLHLPNVNFLATKTKNNSFVFGLSAVFNNLCLKLFTFLRASFGSHSENTVILQTRKSSKLDAQGVRFNNTWACCIINSLQRILICHCGKKQSSVV